MDFDLNKREFRDAVRLRYDWPIPDNPSVCVCGSMFTVDHAMICQRGGLVIQRHNEIRDIEILAPSKSTGFMKMKRSKNTTLASQK